LAERNYRRIQILRQKNSKNELRIILPFLLQPENENENDNENENNKKDGLIDELKVMVDQYMSVMHQLINPYVHILYISSTDMTPTEILRHIDNLEKLTNLNVFDIRKRFHFITATHTDFFSKSKINPKKIISLTSTSTSTSIVYTKGRVQDRISYYLSIFQNVTFLPINNSEKEMKICQALKIPNHLNHFHDISNLNIFQSKSWMKKVIS
jgi:hypothetical protein